MQAIERSKTSKALELALRLAESQAFATFMVSVIVANTCSLLVDRHPFNLVDNQIIENLNIFFAVMYCAELLIKLLAYGFKSYLMNQPLNIFDTTLVIFSLIDIFVANLVLSKMKENNMINNSIAITVIRA
jgi:Ion transport protein